MDEIELTRKLAPSVAPPDGGRKNLARAALRRAASARPRRLRWPTIRPRRAVILALATGIFAIALARGPFFWMLSADPAAAAALEDAATVAGGAPQTLNIGDGYMYTKTDALWAFSSADWTYLRPLVREFWIAADGSGRIRESVEEPIFLSEAERQTWLAGGFDTYAINEDYGPGDLSSASGLLPADLDALRDFVHDIAEGSDRPIDVSMFVTIGDLLRDPLTPPDVRAGLFQLAATLPGIQLLGPMADEVGRQGLAVAMSEWGRQEIIIFDPESSDLLEERTIRDVPYGDTPAPIVWSRSTYLEATVVPQLPAE